MNRLKLVLLMTRGEREFLKKVAQHNMAEVRTRELAQAVDLAPASTGNTCAKWSKTTNKT